MIKTLLENEGYIPDETSGIWSRPGYCGISYSDGDEIEIRISNIIENATDITVLSSELRHHCTDWTTSYHLAATRANIIRPFTKWLTGDVLEIGAGCGAITRFLGECGGTILALEGSPRRAAITRSRTRDLDNVQVLAEKFDNFKPEIKFDVITLIGVLEYANLFTSSDNPHVSMLRQVRSLLKTDGKLIIAIENQLGLKYFAGAPEDHLGEPMIGIEGRYQTNQPQTFGRHAISEILAEAGFDATEFFTPFPDYKHPVSILTENGVLNRKFDAAAFAAQSAGKDPQLPLNLNFSIELTWPEIFNNRLAIELSNSFLIICSSGTQKVIDTDTLALHYSVNRYKEFCKETEFRSDGSDQILVDYRRLDSLNHDRDNTSRALIHFICPISAKYIHGKTLSSELVEILGQKSWTIDLVASFLNRYLSFIDYVSKSKERDPVLNSPYSKISGLYFDAVPNNIIVNSAGELIIIDSEWRLTEMIEIGHLLFRSLLTIISSLKTISIPSPLIPMTNYQFIDQTLRAIGIIVTREDYDRYALIESQIQHAVSGRPIEDFFLRWKDQLISRIRLTDQVGHQTLLINNLEASISKKDQSLASLKSDVNRMNNNVNQLQEMIFNLKMEVDSVYKSHSWKVTKPLRLLHKLFYKL